ncbi:MAG: SDR family oxidoreductase [Prochlorococcus sp.]
MLTELVKQSAPLPAGSKLLVLGGGFSGQHVAALVRALGNTALCSRRKINSQDADLAFDSATKLLPTQKALEGVTHLLSCIPPATDGTDPVLTCLGDQLKTMPLQWVGYLSTTGVYGDSGGRWVSENDLPHPQQARSQRRLACEQAWQNSGLPIQILRLPGIYGPYRSVLQSINTRRSKMIDKPGQVFSRVHVDDIAGATLHLIQCTAAGKWPVVVNVTDDLPAASKDLLTYGAKLLGRSLPPLEPFAIAAKQMSPMALSFWQENRRVSNQLLCQELGYSLIHPDYHSGLRDCYLVEGFKALQTNPL